MTASIQPANAYRNILESLLSEADIRINGTRPHDIRVHDERFFRRVVSDGRLGMGESYMDGWWDCDQLNEMFFKLFCTDSKLQLQYRNWKFWLSILKAKLLRDGSVARSDNVGKKHYDLGNDLFEVMLDKSMMYTCGIWDNARTLEDAQQAKLEVICQKLKLKPGMTLLDIGCGFGALSKMAAEKYGVKVVGITVSKEQAKLAQQRCAGLPIEIRFQDYRHVTEKFDRIACIEMSEHVGLNYYGEFIKKVRSCLNEDGIFFLQTGGINISKYNNLWLTTYLFPGSFYPSLAEIFPRMENNFVLEHFSNIGPDYYQTFMAWYDNFIANWDKLKHKYDQRFYRMWTYYLLSTAAGFKARRAQVWQMVFTPRGMVGGYRYEAPSAETRYSPATFSSKTISSGNR